MVKLLSLALSVLIVLFGSLGQRAAQAEIVTITYISTVGFTGYDTSGVFGTPATDLVGAPLVARFVFDLSLGDRASAPHFDQIVGGPQIGLSMPMIEASLTVNGRQVAFPTNGHMVMIVQEFDPTLGTFGFATQYYDPPYREDVFNLNVSAATIRPSLTTAFFENNVRGGGNFQYRTDDPVLGAFQVFALGQFQGGSLRLEVGRVPEPPALGLALFGAVILLLQLSRRQRVSAGAA